MSVQQVDFLLAGIRDTSGQPLTAGKVYAYAAGTTTPKNTYTDSAGTTPATNPIILDAYGRAQIYADGAYKFLIKDSSDATLYTWDNLYFSRVTTATSSWPDIYGGTSSGSANAITVTVPLSLTSYSAGQQFSLISNQTVSGATTLNVNGIGAVSVVKYDTGAALNTGDIITNELITVIYDSGSGGRFRLLTSTNKISAKQLQTGEVLYGGTSGGSANAQTISVVPALPAYVAGQKLRFSAGFTPTASPTLNVSSLGAKTIKHALQGVSLVSGEFSTGQLCEVEYDGTDFRLLSPSSPVIHRMIVGTTVTNTTAATTIYSFSIPANTLTAGRTARLTLMGDLINTTGVGRFFTFKVTLGASQLAQHSTANIPDAVNSGPYQLVQNIYCTGASSQQNIGMLDNAELTSNNGTASLTIGATNANRSLCGYISSAIDSTIANTIAVTVTPNAADVNLTARSLAAVLEIL